MEEKRSAGKEAEQKGINDMLAAFEQSDKKETELEEKRSAEKEAEQKGIGNMLAAFEQLDKKEAEKATLEIKRIKNMNVGKYSKSETLSKIRKTLDMEYEKKLMEVKNIQHLRTELNSTIVELSTRMSQIKSLKTLQGLVTDWNNLRMSLSASANDAKRLQVEWKSLIESNKYIMTKFENLLENVIKDNSDIWENIYKVRSEKYNIFGWSVPSDIFQEKWVMGLTLFVDVPMHATAQLIGASISKIEEWSKRDTRSEEYMKNILKQTKFCNQLFKNFRKIKDGEKAINPFTGRKIIKGKRTHKEKEFECNHQLLPELKQILTTQS